VFDKFTKVFVNYFIVGGARTVIFRIEDFVHEIVRHRDYGDQGKEDVGRWDLSVDGMIGL
jgi:hypothetical protein